MSFQDIPANSVSGASSSNASVGDQLRSSLSLEIFKINANVQGIRSLAEQIGTARDSPTIRARLRDLTEVTRALAQRASTDVKQLAAHGPQGPARRKILADLDASLRGFQAAQRFSADRQRTNIAAPMHPHATDPLFDGQPQTQTQRQTRTLVYTTEDAFRDAEIAERQSAIREIEQSMTQIADIFRDLAVLVDSQGADIAVVEDNTARTARDLERGADALASAARNQRRAQRTCLSIILGVVCAVVIFAVLI
ncbi:t-SNARE [Mycena epipterygia]|nr:t-SNARE [Mycena epipterygia]